jgi:hypothetical protein
VTRNEAEAFNAGVRAALGAASIAADALEKRSGFREGREGFATAALRGFGQSGAALLRGGETEQRPSQIATPLLPVPALRAAAMVKGYTGEACSECNNFTLLRNGTCLKCDTCGATTGCS